MKKDCISKSVSEVFTICLLLLSACGAQLKHVSSESLNGITIQKPARIMVADIGDARKDENFNGIGQGFSYWMPSFFFSDDEEGKQLPVSYYIAKSLSEDLKKIGYQTKMANDPMLRRPLTFEESLAVAKKEGTDYLVTSKLTDGKTNYWGFIVIPFFEPVWTRIGIDSQLLDTNDEKNITPFRTYKKEIEWYFAKITVLDAIFDAGIFGRHWHKVAWGKTVVSDALAETTKNISDKIQSK